MKSKNFSKQFWQEIEAATEKELLLHPQPVAAFDADGTLWDTDLGENFFRYQIAHCNLPGLPADPWTHYRNWKDGGDPRPAYLWLAQINQGQKIETVRKWAAECLQKQKPLPFFEPQKALIEYFLKKGVQVYVITASIKWSVEPGAKELGIPAENVLGVATQTQEGLVTSNADGVITYREGKALALLEKTKGLHPFFACGNTLGDEALIQSATRIHLGVGSAAADQELYKSERPLAELCQQRGWHYHSFTQSQ
jgi:phosphoserine phosphatase